MFQPDEPLPSVLSFFLAMMLSTSLAFILAFHPVRWRAAANLARFTRIAHAKVLLTLAATVLVIVLQQSAVLALGLVGMGAFVRFRTSIRDPADTAMIFVLVALGMATGLGLFFHAVAASGFLWAIMWLLVPVDEASEEKIDEALDEVSIVTELEADVASPLVNK